MQIPVGTLTQAPATVASGQKLSTVIATQGCTFTGLFNDPTAMTSTTVTFEASTSATGTFVPVCDNTGAPISMTITTTPGYFAVPTPAEFQGIMFLILKFGTNEAATRSITAMMKG